MSSEVRESIVSGAVVDAVRDRRSIRVFAHVPVSRELIERLLRDAMWAPSPHNSQPWRFTVLFDRVDKLRLADAMAAQLRSDLEADMSSPADIEKQTSRSRNRITTAPVAVLCSLVTDGLVEYPDERRTALEWQMAVQSVGSVLQTLFLLAWAQGIGSCWMAAPMYCPDVVRRALALPRSYEPQALALLGYSSKPGRVRERRAIDTVVDLR